MTSVIGNRKQNLKSNPKKCSHVTSSPRKKNPPPGASCTHSRPTTVPMSPLTSCPEFQCRNLDFLLVGGKYHPPEKYSYSCTELNLTMETDGRICKGTHKTGTARTPSLPHAHTSCHTHTNARHAPMTACPLLAVRACVRLCARVFIYVRLCMLKKSSQHSQHRLLATAAAGGSGMAGSGCQFDKVHIFLQK